MAVVDELLYALPLVAATLAVLSLLSRRAWFASRHPSPPVQVATDVDPTPGGMRIFSSLLMWLALRLLAVWVVVLIVRLATRSV